MTLRYRISFGPHIVLIKISLIFIESYLIFPLNIFVFYFFVITVITCFTFLLSVYLAPSPAEAPHCSVVFWPRLPRHCSSGFWCLKWMLSERLPSGLSNKCKVVQTRKEDESDPQEPAGGLCSIKTPFREMIECRSVCRGSCRDAAGTQDGLASRRR